MENIGQESPGSQGRLAEIVGAGSLTEALFALGAVVLSIIGLAGGLPRYSLPVAVIALGVGFLFQGASLAEESREAVRRRMPEGTRVRVTGALTAETLAGLAGVTLGVLGLVHVAPVRLAAIAVLAFSGALFFGGGFKARIGTTAPGAGPTAEQTSRASMGGEMVVGLGALALGILALIGIAPLTLVLVATLSLGAAELLAGSALGATLLAPTQHRPA